MKSRPTVALVDYGAGNLTSVAKALRAAGGEVRRAVAPSHLDGADAIVVPGVGHFAATRPLDAEWRRAIAAAVEVRTALLGICLGLQWLFEGSDEAPDAPGVGIFAGRCERLSGSVKVPHVGWNTLDLYEDDSRLLASIDTGAFAYFSHSYAAPVVADTVASTNYAGRFTAAVERGRVFGVQFHPELSAETGLQVLRNFIAVAAQN